MSEAVSICTADPTAVAIGVASDASVPAAAAGAKGARSPVTRDASANTAGDAGAPGPAVTVDSDPAFSHKPRSWCGVADPLGTVPARPIPRNRALRLSSKGRLGSRLGLRHAVYDTAEASSTGGDAASAAATATALPARVRSVPVVVTGAAAPLRRICPCSTACEPCNACCCVCGQYCSWTSC